MGDRRIGFDCLEAGFLAQFVLFVVNGDLAEVDMRLRVGRLDGHGHAVGVDRLRVLTLQLLDQAEMVECLCVLRVQLRSEEHTSELQSLMRISYAVFGLKKKTTIIMQHKNVRQQSTYTAN